MHSVPGALRQCGARGRHGAQPEGEILTERMKLISSVGRGPNSYFTSGDLKGRTLVSSLCVFNRIRKSDEWSI